MRNRLTLMRHSSDNSPTSGVPANGSALKIWSPQRISAPQEFNFFLRLRRLLGYVPKLSSQGFSGSCRFTGKVRLMYSPTGPLILSSS
jgi:hypothetical protein